MSSIYTCISLNGEFPASREPGGNVPFTGGGAKMAAAEEKTFDHQNSSSACPVEERENMARFVFRGILRLVEALSAGTLKTDGEVVFPKDMGRIREAGGD